MMRNRLVPLAGMALLALLLSSCGEGDDPKVKAESQANTYWPYWASKKWTTNKIGWWLWAGAPFTEADERDADDLTRFHESVFSRWKVTLNHGYVPRVYLSRPRIIYDDATKGELPGIEKIRPVVSRIAEKCGAFSPSRKQGIPVRVVWMDSSIMKQSRLGNVLGAFRTGTQTGLSGLFGSEESETPFGERPKVPSLSVQTTTTPENLVYVWGGRTEEERKEVGQEDGFGDIGFDPKTRTWKQTWKDYFGIDPGGKPIVEGDPGKVWYGLNKYNGDKGHTADQTFAHELGHAFLVEWALSNGRSAIWTRTFDEMFAEMFMNICYNDQYPYRTDYAVVNGKQVFTGWKPTSGGGLNPLVSIDSLPFNKEDCGTKVACNSLATFVRADPVVPLVVDERGKPQNVTANALDPNQYIAPFSDDIQLTLASEGRWNEDERKRIFGAVLKTLDAMQGVRLGECAPLTVAGNIQWTDPMGDIKLGAPRQHPYAGECPWGMNAGDRVLPLEERPLAFTAREFWTLFPRFYELPKRHQATAQSITDLLNVVWEY
jgi:hypothetical protein